MNQTQEPGTSEALMRDLAAGLRDVIREVPLSSLEQDPENAFLDLACRLVFQMRAKVTVVSVSQAGQTEAAQRILEILTRWMQTNGRYELQTAINMDDKFALRIKVKNTHVVRAFFTGESLQDCYAQAAQTVEFGGGGL